MKKRNIFVLCFLWMVVSLYPQVIQTVYAETREIAITVDTDGFTPPLIKLKKGEQVRLIFTRKTNKTCVTRVKIPDMDIDAELPLDTPVSFLVKPDKTGDVGFSCPMDMLKGKLKVN